MEETVFYPLVILSSSELLLGRGWCAGSEPLEAQWVLQRLFVPGPGGWRRNGLKADCVEGAMDQFQQVLGRSLKLKKAFPDVRYLQTVLSPLPCFQARHENGAIFFF